MTHDIVNTMLKVLAAGSGIAAIVWGILAKYGDRWSEQKFANRLETFRHEKAKGLEQLRHRITSLFSRITKIHDKEFEILPEAFLRLHKAYAACFELGSALQKYPALNQMGDSQFAEFVQACRLPAFRKLELLQEKDREIYFRWWIFWTDMAEAKALQSDFHNFLVMNRIFMTSELQKQFGEIDRLISSVISALEIDRQTPGSGLVTKARSDLDKVAPLLDPLEAAIQKRLHYSEA
jgi:hypothetical protein